ncbi:MAG: 50S ribosomal protein L22 [Candidatus Nanoarchaeia archaeon]
MTYNYSFQRFDPTTMARGCAINTRISLKKSVEVSRAIKGMRVSRAKEYLQDVMAQKQVVEYKRFNQEMPHKRGKGIMAGGFPVNVAEQFFKVLHNCEQNAQNLNLGEAEDLRIVSASVRQGAGRYKMSRLSGRKMKATHIEIIVTQDTKKKHTKKTKQSGGNTQ